MRSNAAGLTLLAALVCGCSGFNEAARDRLGWTFAGRTPSLRLRCETPSPLPAPVMTAATTPARLIVRGGQNPERPAVVGELFKWGGGSFAAPQEGKILIVLEHPANDVLVGDVIRILLRNGFTVADDAQGSVPVLEAAVAGLNVKGFPPGLVRAKGNDPGAGGVPDHPDARCHGGLDGLLRG